MNHALFDCIVGISKANIYVVLVKAPAVSLHVYTLYSISKPQVGGSCSTSLFVLILWCQFAPPLNNGSLLLSLSKYFGSNNVWWVAVIFPAAMYGQYYQQW
jgi:hypothetical protein